MQNLPLQRLRVIDLALLKQAGAFERMLTQHAMAPAMNREDGRLVHGARGTVQAQRVVQQVWATTVTQLQQEVVGRCEGGRITMKHAGCLREAFADAFPQLFHGSIGEGHHQNLPRL